MNVYSGFLSLHRFGDRLLDSYGLVGKPPDLYTHHTTLRENRDELKNRNLNTGNREQQRKSLKLAVKVQEGVSYIM